MALKIYLGPTVEPVTLQEAKRHLNLDSGSFEGNVSVNQSIAPGSHGVAGAYSLKGSGIDVSTAGDVLAVLEAGGFGSPAGTVDVKLQESDTDIDGDYEDVSGGAFSQVTGANDSQTFELAYTGTRKYVRAVATVAGAACEFGVSLVLNAPVNSDDADISRCIKAARRYCEKFQNRAFCSQTWDFYLDSFPDGDEISIPLPPLQSVTTLKYKDGSGTLQTWAASNYIVDTISTPGRIVIASGNAWPAIYDEIQAVQIRFVAGYGAAADVPEEVKQAVLLKVTDLYEHRGDEVSDPRIDNAIKALLWDERIVPI